jgi:hypothetical protein
MGDEIKIVLWKTNKNNNEIRFSINLILKNKIKKILLLKIVIKNNQN